jgi:hypothetical protein
MDKAHATSFDEQAVWVPGLVVVPKTRCEIHREFIAPSYPACAVVVDRSGSWEKERSEYGPMPFTLLVVLLVVAAVALLILIYVLVQRRL